MKIEEIYALPVDQFGWRKLPTGDDVKLGNGVKLGDDVTLGNGVTLGDYVKLGNGVTLGDYVKLGDDGLEYKWSPLQIQGSRHLLYVAGPAIIGIGCHRHDAAWWLDHYKATGRVEGYTPDQVEEYKAGIDIAVEWQKKLKAAA